MKKAMAVWFVLVILAAAFLTMAPAPGRCAAKAEFEVKKSVPQSTPLPQELYIEVIKKADYELPDFTDEAKAQLLAVLAEQFMKAGWTVKENAADAPLALSVINSFQQGSKKNATVAFIALGVGGGLSKTKIGANIALSKDCETIFKANARFVAEEKEYPIKDLIPEFAKTVEQGISKEFQFQPPRESQK